MVSQENDDPMRYKIPENKTNSIYTDKKHIQGYDQNNIKVKFQLHF